MTEVGTTGKTAIEGNRSIRAWKVDGHLATTSSAGEDHLARRANKWDGLTQSLTIRQRRQGDRTKEGKAGRFRPCDKSMEGEVKLESLNRAGSKKQSLEMTGN